MIEDGAHLNGNSIKLNLYNVLGKTMASGMSRLHTKCETIASYLQHSTKELRVWRPQFFWSAVVAKDMR